MQVEIPILYNVAIEGDGIKKILIDWGNTPGWIEEHQEKLHRCDRLTLIPKAPGTLPLVTVQLGEPRRWILFSRVIGRMEPWGRNQTRLYAIGWQTTINGENVKSIVWVYPTGDMEVGDEPSKSLIDGILKAQAASVVQYLAQQEEE